MGKGKGKVALPYAVTSNLSKYVRLRQAEVMEQTGATVHLQHVYDEIARYTGVTAYTISMVKSGSYSPSFTLAFLIRDYFNSLGYTLTVDDLFGIRPLEEKE